MIKTWCVKWYGDEEHGESSVMFVCVWEAVTPTEHLHSTLFYDMYVYPYSLNPVWPGLYLGGHPWRRRLYVKSYWFWLKDYISACVYLKAGIYWNGNVS